MNKELEKHFIEKYPKIFKDMYGDPMKTCMAFGIECQNGWFIILDTLCASIQSYIDSRNNYPVVGQEPVPQLVAEQIKEKFGTLRFYHSGGDDFCDGLISMAEGMTYSTCELCGHSGLDVGSTKGWIQYICTDCSKKIGKEISYNVELQKLQDKIKKPNEK